MSTSSLGINSTTGAPITITGLASGLETSKIIAALMGAEREPVTHLTDESQKLQAEQTELQSIQSSLRQLASAISEFSLPSLFEESQAVTSNEPARVSAVVTSGAGVGGYEVEVTQLANAAQRTFTFASPKAEETVTIEGHEFKLEAGESAKEFASAINTNSGSPVYAAVLEGETLVLSTRATGSTGGEFIKVTGAGEALTERPETAKEGKDAEFKVDGVEGKSSTNTVTNAIAGVTLTLGGLTTATGPVTIDVQAPGPSASKVEAQVQAFVKLYNSTVETIQTQLATKPPVKPESGEFGVGVLFGDVELTGLLDGMRDTMYESVSGLETSMSSPFDVGISTGSPTGEGASSQSSLEGLLTLEPAKLSEAVKSNPVAVETMLQQWSQNLQGLVEGAGAPGGTLEARASGDGTQISQLASQIGTMNELLAQREKALQETYAKLESVISHNTEQSAWLTQQEESLSKSGI